MIKIVVTMLFKFIAVFLGIVLISNYVKADILRTKTLKKMFENAGWKKLNDLKSVIHENIHYSRDDIVKYQSRISEGNLDSIIRVSTISMGFAYANVLKKLFFIIDHTQEYCEKINESSIGIITKGACKCELTYIVSKVVSLSKIMKDAMDTLDDLHTRPWKKIVKPKYLLSTMFKNMETYKESFYELLEKKLYSKYILNFIKEFFSKRNSELIESVKDNGEVIFEDLISIMQNWRKEYENNPLKDTAGHTFYDDISRKVDNIIKTTVKEKMIDLGFNYDKNKDEISIRYVYNGTDKVLGSMNENFDYMIADIENRYMHLGIYEDPPELKRNLINLYAEG